MDDIDGDDDYSGSTVVEPSRPAPPIQPLQRGNTPEWYEAFYLPPALLRRFTRLSRLSTIRLDPSEPCPPLVWVAQDDRYLYDYLNDDFGVDDGDAYGNGGFGAVPASGVATACLKETTVGEGEVAEEAECAVCLEGYETGQTLMRTMPCEHEFHESCIFEWLRVSRFCPLCRFALPAEC